jgi:dTDP-6-deoxy-L-talose 4-dehydrogenase (NAD+)
MRKILITGATGFVGRQVLYALRDTESQLLPLVREGKEDLVAGKPNVELVISSKDIFSEPVDWWVAQCHGVDTIIHTAWYAEPGKYLQSIANMDCLTGSLNLARGAAKAGVKQFVGIGTCFEYDLSGGVLSVDTPLRPLSLYAAAKAALFLALSEWLPGQSVKFSWCRLFFLYGEGEDERRLVPYIHKQLSRGETVELTGGNQIRDFLDVSEAGRLIAKVALGDQQGPINICSGVPITVRQLAERIANEYGQLDMLKFGARANNLIDPPCVLGIPNHGFREKI